MGVIHKGTNYFSFKIYLTVIRSSIGLVEPNLPLHSKILVPLPPKIKLVAGILLLSCQSLIFIALNSNENLKLFLLCSRFLRVYNKLINT